MTIRVFIVDDHVLVRTGIRMILSGQDGISVVGEADSGELALPQIRKLNPDVVVCDFHLPGISGLEVTERIVKSKRETRVVVVSVLEDGPMPKRLLDAGAAGYVGKTDHSEELVRAVREAARGRRYLAGSVARYLVLSQICGEKNPFDGLSPRELEVALLMLHGMRQESIARRLSLSPKTVNTHKSRLFEKLQIEDSMALVRLANQYGVIDPDQELSPRYRGHVSASA